MNKVDRLAINPVEAIFSSLSPWKHQKSRDFREYESEILALDELCCSHEYCCSDKIMQVTIKVQS